MSDWDFTDVWVLAAVGSYRRPCALADLVAAGDWINHAILLPDEVEGALGKLTGAGLVRVFEDWTCELTEDGLTLWAGRTNDLQAQLKAVQEQLGDFEPGRGEVRLPRALWEKAVADYQERS